jgi:Icc protein
MSDILLSSVGQTFAIFHHGTKEYRDDGLEPGQAYERHGHRFSTLPDLGPRLSAFGTVNDVHFGETQCGLIEGSDVGPVLSVGAGETPYPEVMNAAVIDSMKAHALDAVLVKGDLTSNGRIDEFNRFRAVYETAFAEKLHFIRGNHESYHSPEMHAVSQIHRSLPGVELAMIDTSKPGFANGTIRAEDLNWLEALAKQATAPVLVFGHHHIWSPRAERDKHFFGIEPDASESLIELMSRHESLVGYFAGHTHRNRVQRIDEKLYVEVASVKEFPGMWAHYEVFEGGILQVNHRANTDAALLWSEKTRVMYNGRYFDYAFGSLDERSFLVCRT